MRFCRNTFGYFLATIVINGSWGFFINKFGLFGGYGAAFLLTGSMWYVNHYIGLVKQDEDAAFVDMGLGIGISLVAKGYIIHGASSVISSIPTFVLVVIGAVLGGITAVAIERNILEAKSKKKSFEKINLKLAD